MHSYVARLDMIILLTQPEPLNEYQQLEIQRVLKQNKILFQESTHYAQIKNLYIRRYPRLEETLTMEMSIDQIYDFCSRQYLREIKKPGIPALNTYQNIITTHRLQQNYFLKEPVSSAQQYSCLDLEQDESTKCLLMAQLYNRNRFNEPRLVYMSDLLRKKMSQMIKEVSDRNLQIQRSILNYYNINKRKQQCQSSTPTKSRNNTFYRSGGKVSALRIHTEFVIEKRTTPTRSIYQVKKIQLLDENSDATPLNKSSCKALGRPRSLIRTKFQQLLN